MKKRNALALALAAGLVLGGANTAHAEGWTGSYEDQWAAASAEQDKKIEAEKKAKLEEELANDWKDPNKSDWERVAEELEKEKENKEEDKDLGSEWEDPNKSDWEKVADELDKEKLETAKKEAIEELKKAGITGEIFFKQINNAKTVEGVNALKAEILKANKGSEEKPEEKPEEQGPKVTIDEWLLKEAKKEAIEELKKAGITGQIYFDQINKAKTIEGVETLKNEILKANKAKDDNKKPGKDEDKKPGKEDDKKVVIPGYKIEDIAKPNKKEKEDGSFKPGYATREEAEKAAKEALKKNKTKDSYTIFEDYKGRFGYYLWSKADEEAADRAAKIKEASKANEKANQKASTPKAQASNPNRAPKTGVAGMSAVAGLAAVSVAGILATRKKED